MLRVLLTIVLPLVLPTAIYLAWVRTTQPAGDSGPVRWRARPDAVIAALEKARIKVVPTGIEHGTVTAVVSDPGPSRHFEITTLRRDVETYGRRARVAFDADRAEDAARRDFTINAIYIDP